MAEVKWIKITTDVFDDEKILLIESLPEADSIIVIWFKLLCLAGKQNNSGVFMMGNSIPYTDKMLATIFRRKETTVQLALETFARYGMIEMIDDVITIPNWGKHQNLEQIEARREYQREYQREYRQKQKLLVESDSKCLRKHLCNDDVNNLDKIREEREEEGEKDEDNLEIIRGIVAYLNMVCGTNYKYQTANTRKHIRARLSEGFDYEDFQTVIDKKSKEWLNTPMEKYLRPDTLFGTKFESYLNQNIVEEKKSFSNTGGIDWSKV